MSITAGASMRKPSSIGDPYDPYDGSAEVASEHEIVVPHHGSRFRHVKRLLYCCSSFVFVLAFATLLVALFGFALTPVVLRAKIFVAIAVVGAVLVVASIALVLYISYLASLDSPILYPLPIAAAATKSATPVVPLAGVGSNPEYQHREEAKPQQNPQYQSPGTPASPAPQLQLTVRKAGCFFALLCVAAVLLILSLAVFCVPLAWYSSLPPTSATIRVLTDTTAATTLQRSAGGVFVADAATPAAAMAAMGVAHATDRLFQLDLLRRLIRGTLSDAVGAAGAELDTYSATMGFREAGRKSWNDLRSKNATVAALLVAYVDGINSVGLSSPCVSPWRTPRAALDREPLATPEELDAVAKVLQYTKRPPEMQLLRSSFTAYHPEDVLGGLAYFYTLLADDPDEARRWSLFVEGLSYDSVLQFIPVEDTSAPIMDDAAAEALVSRSPDASRYPWDPTAAVNRRLRSRFEEKRIYSGPMAALLQKSKNYPQCRGTHPVSSSRRRTSNVSGAGFAPSEHRARPSARDLAAALIPAPSGSNAWVWSDGIATSTVANDPHMTYGTPAAWYPMSFNTGSGASRRSIAGVTFPGTGLMLGRGGTLSVAITLSKSDVSDFVVLEPDASDPCGKYIVNGTSVAYNTSIAKVNGVDVHLRHSIYGPIVNEVYNLAGQLPIALATAPLQHSLSDSLISASELLFHGHHVNDFVDAALSMGPSPFSLVAGDANGGRAWALTGIIPIRSRGHTGTLPVLGNGSYDDFKHLAVPVSLMPRVVVPGGMGSLNPGVLFAANHNPVSSKYPVDIASSQSLPHVRRAAALSAVLAQWDSYDEPSIDAHAAVQTDSTIYYWNQTRNLSFLATSSFYNSPVLQCKDLLLQWDGNTVTGTREAAVFHGLLVELAKLPFVPGASKTAFSSSSLDSVWASESLYSLPFQLLYSNAVAAEIRAFCLARNATDIDCNVFRMEALHRACLRFGNSHWGSDVNVQFIEHVVMKEAPVGLSDIWFRSFGVSGCADCINNARASPSAEDFPFSVNIATAWRSISRMSLLGGNKYLFSMPMGPSANPVSPYYDSLLTNFITARYQDLLVVPDVAPSVTITPCQGVV